MGFVTLVLIGSLVVVAGFPLNHDVAWFMSIARRILEGEELYRDVLDVNPPLVDYLMMPAVILSDLLGVPEGITLRALVVGVAGCMILWFIRIVGIRGPFRTAWWLILLLCGLLVVPAADFGQREHLLVLLTLPFVALKWQRISEDSCARKSTAYAAGAVAGLGFALKPHFALIWLALEAFDWVNRRQVSRKKTGGRPESIAVLAVLAGYTLLVVSIHPAYFSLLRRVAPLYGMFVGEGKLLPTLVYSSLPMLMILLAVAFPTKGDLQRRPTLLFLIFAGAGLAVAAIQGKGWRYHTLPLLIATVFAWGTLLEASVRILVQNGKRQAVRRASLAIGLLLLAVYPFTHNLARALTVASLRSTMLSHQTAYLHGSKAETFLVLSDKVSDGFPLATYIGARWVSPHATLWWIRARYGSGDPPPNRVSALDEAERFLSKALIADFVATPPDLVLVDTMPHERIGGRTFPYVDYFGADSAFAALWTSYERVGTMSQFAIWSRTEDPESSTSESSDLNVPLR